MEKNLYFIAIIPPEEVRNEILAFQQDLARHYDTKAALKVIPHITLKIPFKLSISAHAALLQWFQGLFIPVDPFTIELKNFGSFSNKYKPVIFVQPVMNTALYVLQKEIIRSFRISYPELETPDIELKFKPHITVAYRDLAPDKFPAAWSVYQTKIFSAVFRVDRFHLLQHNGKQWNIIDAAHMRIPAI
jgi:2'-5' RNA ligase